MRPPSVGPLLVLVVGVQDAVERIGYLPPPLSGVLTGPIPRLAVFPRPLPHRVAQSPNGVGGGANLAAECPEGDLVHLVGPPHHLVPPSVDLVGGVADILGESVELVADYGDRREFLDDARGRVH